MGLPLHTVDMIDGSSPLSNSDRLKVGLLRGVAIAALIGALTGGEVLNPGTGFTSVPTLSGAGGTGATLTASMAIELATIAAAGGAPSASYAPGDLNTMTGGTAAQQAIAEVLTTKLVGAAVSAAGGATNHSYAPGDTYVPVGGTFTGSPLITITGTQAVSATVVSGGTGGTPGAVTLTGTTGTGTKFQATGTINGSGVLTGALVVSVAGDYTVNPTSLAVEPVTDNASATGITVSLVMGAKTATATGGVFTANGSGFTQGSTSGQGTGATFTGIFGVDTFELQNAGTYSVLPSSPVSQGSSTGSGTGFELTVSAWQVQSFTATGGQDYADGALVTASGGGGTGFEGQASTTPIGEPIAVPITQFPVLPPNYSVFVTLNGLGIYEVSAKTQEGFVVTVFPPGASQPVYPASMDILVVA